MRFNTFQHVGWDSCRKFTCFSETMFHLNKFHPLSVAQAEWWVILDSYSSTWRLGISGAVPTLSYCLMACTGITLPVSLKVPSVTCETLDAIITFTADFNGPLLKIRNYVKNYCCRRCVIKVIFCFIRDCFSHRNHISLSYTTCFLSEQEHMYRRFWHTGKRNLVLLF